MHASIHASIHSSINPSGQINPSKRSARLRSSRRRNKSSTGRPLRFGLVRFSGASLGASSCIGRAGRWSKTKTADSAMVVHRSENARWPVLPKCQFKLSALEKLLGAGIISKWTSEGWDTWIRKIRVEWSHYRCNVPTARTGQTAAEIYSSSFLLDNVVDFVSETTGISFTEWIRLCLQCLYTFLCVFSTKWRKS